MCKKYCARDRIGEFVSILFLPLNVRLEGEIEVVNFVPNERVEL